MHTLDARGHRQGDLLRSGRSQGKTEEVRKVLTEVRKLDPNRIFTKVQGIPHRGREEVPGPPRLQAGLHPAGEGMEGPEPGGQGPAVPERGEKVREPLPKKARCRSRDLKKIVDEVSK